MRCDASKRELKATNKRSKHTVAPMLHLSATNCTRRKPRATIGYSAAPRTRRFHAKKVRIQ